jgi:16S rRNA (adenine1518-N6/adenine1519-N6)-dimethyltransferase
VSTAGPAPLRIDPGAVRRTLREAGLRARHSLSQNFLADPDVLDTILAEAAPGRGVRVLEIGPGLGILTDALLGAGAAVTAVEVDRGLVRWLRSEHERALVAGGRDPLGPGALTLLHADALDLELVALVPPPYEVVANLPYHVTSPVLHRLLGAPPRPVRLVVMVQREVAERIAAPPGGLSYLSLFCQYHAAVRIAARVPPTAFEPAPAVESAIIVLEPWAQVDPAAPPRLDPEQEDGLWRVVQAAFRERRKMLRNVLVRQLPLPPDAIERALTDAGIDGRRRPQTVAIDEWLRLVAALGPIGPDTRGRRRSAEEGEGRSAAASEAAGAGAPPHDPAASPTAQVQPPADADPARSARGAGGE